jgi:hypothetical protein
MDVVQECERKLEQVQFTLLSEANTAEIEKA